MTRRSPRKRSLLAALLTSSLVAQADTAEPTWTGLPTGVQQTFVRIVEAAAEIAYAPKEHYRKLLSSLSGSTQRSSLKTK